MNSMLAAVHAAASEDPHLTASAVITSQQQEISMADKTASPTTAAELQSAFPDLCAQIRTEGVTAERTRILAIEGHALAGHEALIAEMKADPAITADMAAVRLLNAEKTIRAGQLAAVKDVEKVTGAVAAAPLAAAVTRIEEHPAKTEAASTPDGWKAEWEGSKQLQGEFAQADHYVAFKKAEAGGRIKVLGNKKSA